MNDGLTGVLRRRGRFLIFTIGLTVLLALAVSCRTTNKTPVARPTAPCPFDVSYASLDDLGRSTVRAINDGDTLSLWKLAVTEAEFRDVIWPRTPNHNGLNWEYAWSMNFYDARKAINRVLDELGGQKLSYVGVELGDTTVVVYPEKRTYHNVLTVADRLDGERIKFRFLNVVQEVNGWYKVVAFHE